MMPSLHGTDHIKSDASRTGFFYILSFEDKEKLIDQDLLEIFVSAKLHSLVQCPS